MKKIIKATYGSKNVIDIIEKLYINEKFNIFVSNDIFGDPNPGVVKKLQITFDDGSIISQEENMYLVYPKLNKKRLGIFYTNNHNTLIFDTIKLSLETIKKASDNKADILVCSWNRINFSPFNEIIAQTKISSHLNQILQILQLLYYARIQNKDYEYVSFLEHDCLYGEKYFDYPDFNSNCTCNMNYIGLSSDGWQNKNQNDKPLSQITMKFNYAIKHFESILPNALIRNSGLLEPPHDNNNIGEWNCENPSVHVNHGYHFTSHYSIYSKNKFVDHNYWGNYLKYSYLFPQNKS